MAAFLAPLIAGVGKILGGSLGPSLIAGAGGLLGGYFDRKAQQDYNDAQPTLEEQRINAAITERQRFGWLRQGAEKAGFNPLSVLRATSGQMGPQFTQNATPLSSPMAEAVRSATAAYDPIAMENARLENVLLERQIAEIDKNQARFAAGTKVSSSPTRYRTSRNVPTDMKTEADFANTPEGRPEPVSTLDTHVTDETSRTSEQTAGDDFGSLVLNVGRKMWHDNIWAKEDAHNDAISRFPLDDQRPQSRPPSWSSLGPMGIQNF